MLLPDALLFLYIPLSSRTQRAGGRAHDGGKEVEEGREGRESDCGEAGRCEVGQTQSAVEVDRKTGWQYVCLEEEWTRGYLQEIQDFMECVATGRQPRSDLALAFETIKVNYAGYWAAEEGRRVTL